jgi:biotin-(acetyl-CoA carboxylase) ligase
MVSGRKVSVAFEGKVAVGVATGIDEYGALLVQQKNGETARVLAGDVSLVD